MRTALLVAALGVLVAAQAAALWQAVRGPTLTDRLLGGSIAGNVLTFVLLVAGMLAGSELYFDAVIAAALLSFSGTLIVARWIITRRVL